MELEELKNTWATLDNRLKENKTLTNKVILEMIEAKTNKSLNKLMVWELLSILVFIVLIPFITYCFYRYHGKLIFWDITLIYALFICLLSTVWYIVKAYGLVKIDLTKMVTNNIYHVNRYQLQIKWERILMEYFIGPSLAVLCIITYAEEKASVQFWVLLICAIAIATVFTYWGYRSVYQKNIRSILKNLEELKELKED